MFDMLESIHKQINWNKNTIDNTLSFISYELYRKSIRYEPTFE